MNLVYAHLGDIHLEEDRYFADTARCLEWFVVDAIQASVDFVVINGERLAAGRPPGAVAY